MGLLTGKNGNLSFVRVSLTVMVVGLALAGAGLLSFQFDQESRRTPLEIQAPAGAEALGDPQLISTGYQRRFYRVGGMDAEGVASYYDAEMLKHYGVQASDPEREKCLRFPPIGKYTPLLPGERPANDLDVYDPNFIEGQSLPYFYKCLFDRSTNLTQYTEVTIHPGLANADPALDNSAYVIVVYEQHWQAR